MSFHLPVLVGILNVTPDSFSDGGELSLPHACLKRLEDMLEQGAGMVDIGAESTRPNAPLVTPEEEWERLTPVFNAVVAHCRAAGIPLSIDTRNHATARRAADAGVDVINDVTGLTEPAMVEVVKQFGIRAIAMHSVTVPADPAQVLQAADVVAEVETWCKTHLAHLIAQGLKREQLVIDPGIGFGKTAEQSVTLLRSIERFTQLGVPVMVGHSRKSFLRLFAGDVPVRERDVETHAVSLHLAARGIDYIRVHDVKGAARAMRAWGALQ